MFSDNLGGIVLNKKFIKAVAALTVACTTFLGINGVTRASEDLSGNNSMAITQNALYEAIENRIEFTEPQEKLVKVINQGKLKVLAAENEDVETLLKKNNIKIDDNSVLSVKLTDMVETGMTIVINERKEVVRKETADIAFETIKVEDDSLEVGKEVVRTEGVTGKTETTYTDEYYNGKLVKSVKGETKTITPKVDKVVAIGTMEPVVEESYDEGYSEIDTTPSRSGNQRTFYLSFYTALPEEGSGYGVTASGEVPQAGMVASNYYPLGTQIYLEGIGNVRVADRGGSSFDDSSRLDVFVARRPGESDYEYKQRALSLGRMVVIGYVK